MGFFNKEQVKAFETGIYICSECGAQMKFEDEYEDVLICPQCGHSEDIDHYGFKDDNDYDALYENDCYEDDDNCDDCGETYDEVCGELDND